MIGTCKVCNRTDLKLFIEFDRYPKSISYLFPDSESAKEDFTKLSFVQCTSCHHVQISRDMPQDFYEDYVMTVSHSKKMNDFQSEQADFFIEKFNLKGKKVLEIGCGDGNFLSLLKEKGCIVFGNEPSKPFRELAVKRGLQLDSNFVDEKFSHSDGPFDAIVSREVIEHVPSPVEFLKYFRNVLKPNGVVLIEGPNFEKALSDLRYYDMFPDHLSYFTRESLTATVLLSGFKNIEIYYGMEAEFIYATAENHHVKGDALKAATNKIKNDFEDLFKRYSNIVVWGAGGKGIAATGSLENVSGIKYIVDSDLNKQGKFLPSSGLEVKSPEILYQDSSVDLLVITNLAYTDEILGILKKNNFKKKVMVLSKDGIKDILI